jgi:hypothetical protein
VNEDTVVTPSVEQAPAATSTISPTLLSGSTVLILATFISVAAACLAVLAYDRLLATKPRTIAVVSLQTVIDAKEAQFAEALSRAGATDDDRVKAFQDVPEFANELAKHVASIASECENCIVLVKDAVVGHADVDLTPKLMARLGIGDVNVAEMRARIRRNVNAAAPALAAAPRKQEAHR